MAEPPDQADRAVRARRQQRHHRAHAGARSSPPRLGQPIIVENKGGAGGTIGTDAVAKAPPDGYTLLFASTSIITNAAAGKKLPYDPVKDLQPIGEIGAGAVRDPRVQRPQGDDAARTDRARAREAEEHQLRLGGYRRHEPPGHRALRVGRQGRARARSVQGHRSRIHRPHRWQPADDRVHRVLGDAVRPFRKDARPRRHRLRSARRSRPSYRRRPRRVSPASSPRCGGVCSAPRDCRRQSSSD